MIILKCSIEYLFVRKGNFLTEEVIMIQITRPNANAEITLMLFNFFKERISFWKCGIY